MSDQVERPQKRYRWGVVLDLLLIAILLAGAYFRLVGFRWGEYHYLHPDERFLLMVGSDITPVKEIRPPAADDVEGKPEKVWISLSEYFDTANSPLNPNNRGHGFYVYGTLPLFLTRILTELTYDQVGLQEIQDIGRPLSALSDLLVVVLVYLIASRLYNRRVGLLASAFYAAAVLPIQLSHFFKEDTFTNFFITLAIFFAVLVGTTKYTIHNTDNVSRIKDLASRFIRQPYFLLSIGFGVALGSAVASKLNAVPVAILLPGAFAIHYFSTPKEERQQRLVEALAYLSLAAVVSLLTFRIFQPYAFSGPGFLGIKPNPLWIEQIRSQRAQAAGDVDFPPALQWARRPVWFSGQNLTVWGLGLPLGILAWAGALWAGWRMLKNEWREHLLIWGWLAFYFTWQTLQFNPTMRYQLPSYPALVIFAAWVVVDLYQRGRAGAATGRGRALIGRLVPALAVLAGVSVLFASFGWAFAFSRIYTRPITRIEASRWILQNIPGPINLRLDTGEGTFNHPLPYYPYDFLIRPGQAYNTIFQARASGVLNEITFAHVVDLEGSADPKTLAVQLFAPGQDQPVASGMLTADFLPEEDPRGSAYRLSLNQAGEVIEGETYTLVIQLESGDGAIQLQGETVANEGAWDDGIPYPVDGFNAFGGIYPQEVNFNMYDDETEEKRERFIRILDQSDYLFITSNRQWGVLPRLPERYPMSTIYYRQLLGCSPERSIQWCYNVAQPGTFQGNLGFELVMVFQSDPNLGSLRINTQFAEEAFTVYDHPKVFIFEKTENYDSTQVQAILDTADLSKVIHLTPKKAPPHPADLMLPTERLTEQRAGGSWSELFDWEAVQNRFQPLGVAVWYLALFVLGLTAYPLLRLALPGLADHGYPVARIAGLLILAYVVWLGGSFRIPASRLTITIVFLFMLGLAGWLAYRQRAELRQEWQERRRYFLLVEGLFLAFFLFDLFIRLGNPDLWHPWKGGEKPMDFAYFNAILKSTTFPPYDPWFSGGYLNYYYYGFILVGVLVKWLGIVPAFAFNLILPTIFSLTAMGAFSVAWNIFGAQQSASQAGKWRAGKQHSASGDERFTQGDQLISQGSLTTDSPGDSKLSPDGGQERAAQEERGLEINQPSTSLQASTGGNLQPATVGEVQEAPPAGTEPAEPPYATRNTQYSASRPLSTLRHLQLWVAISAALGMAMLGNLGTVRMILQGYQRLGSPTGSIEEAGLLTRSVWAVRGFFDALGGETLPYSLGDWYWIPSRTIPPQGDIEPITEFPFFTVLYADPHAHLYALPVALLALSWVVSVVMARGRWKSPGSAAVSFILGGLAIGALYPINLSDIYTYLPLGMIAVGYALWRYSDSSRIALLKAIPSNIRQLIVAGGGILLLASLTLVLYRPYSQWYGQPYSSVNLWPGPLTPISSYLTHWGLFLFVIVSWMIWETRDWMANTPLSALRKLEPYREAILLCLAGLASALLLLQWWANTGNRISSQAHWMGIHIAWLALPLAAWAGVLLLRPGLPESKRLVLFFIGTGLLITVMVEVVVVRGDIGRMNTVFKFYLQVWTLFAVSSAAALGWLLRSLADWKPGWRFAWQIPFAVLVFSAFLFTLLGGAAKIKDRFIDTAPHTLDGMAYMEYVRSYEHWGVILDLNQDYHAIRWVQDNVEGSPVIVEASPGGDQYRWYSRFSIYTGLPAVIGWQWHQMQQRELVSDAWVFDRDLDVETFYLTTDLEFTRHFLRKYAARYIILGQLERGKYAGPGLNKFAELDGVLWRQVYEDRDTRIYEVIQ